MRLIDHLKKKYRILKKEKGIKKETERRGGELERLEARRKRQDDIRKHKAVIIQGLIRSWDLGEIRKPSREEYETLRWFHRGLTLKYLQDLEKRSWS